MALSMKDKYDKYWDNLDNMNFLLHVALVLDPRNKLYYLKYCLGLIYGEPEESEEEMFESDDEDLSKRGQVVKRVKSTLTEFRLKVDIESGFGKYMEKREGIKNTEVDIYLRDGTEKRDEKFDVLVASESAFSTGGRVIDKFRSCLTPKTAEALLCTQDWLRSTPADVEDMQVNAQQLEDLVENLAKIELGTQGVVMIDHLCIKSFSLAKDFFEGVSFDPPYSSRGNFLVFNYVGLMDTLQMTIYPVCDVTTRSVHSFAAYKSPNTSRWRVLYTSGAGSGLLLFSTFVEDRDIMVDVNAPVEQEPVVAPPTRTDEQILPRIRWVPIGKSNCYLDAKVQSNQSNKIAITRGYKCQLDEQWFNLTKDTLRDALRITPVNNNKAFSPPLTQDILINFVNDLGYPKEVKHLSNVITNDMFQPWRALTTIINLCLTGKTSGFERPRAPVLQILWGIINRAHIDYVERMWEEFTQSIHTFTEDKKNLAQV
ncbi:monodehydroascorbate reductase [Tanacetum coccineum]